MMNDVRNGSQYQCVIFRDPPNSDIEGNLTILYVAGEYKDCYSIIHYENIECVREPKMLIDSVVPASANHYISSSSFGKVTFRVTVPVLDIEP